MLSWSGKFKAGAGGLTQSSISVLFKLYKFGEDRYLSLSTASSTKDIEQNIIFLDFVKCCWPPHFEAIFQNSASNSFIVPIYSTWK